MKVVHVVTRDEGGGGRAAYRLHRGLRLLGHESSLYVGTKFHPDASTVVFQPEMTVTAKLQRLVRRTQLRLRSRPYTGRVDPSWSIDHQCQRGADPLAQMPGADVVNIHTIENFVSYDAFFRAVHVPIVWTLHVMAPFTGGCTYSYGCRRFESACGGCPLLQSTDQKDLSHAVWKEKKRAYRHARNLHLVAPSRWMAAEVRQSSLWGELGVTIIPNGIDTELYAPRHAAFARSVLGLAPDASVLLFVTQHSLQYRAKGFALLLEALRGLRHVKNLVLLTLGADSLEDVGIPQLHLGHVFSDQLLSLVYSAADLFVIPSLQDNLPNVVLESMACGTPVVGFDVGGIPDMVRPGITGDLAPSGNVDSLREAILNLLKNPPQRAELSANCRRVALAEYSLERQGRAYADLYTSLLEKTSPP